MGSLIRTISFLLLFAALTAKGQDVNHIIAKGNEAYKQQQYDKAIEYYQEALKQSPKNQVASFNLGNALFRSKKYDEAAGVFEEAAQHTEDKMEQSKLYYNRGVSYTQQKKLPESINAYKQALRMNSKDTLARENLQRALNELKQQQQQNNQQKNQQEKKQEQPKPQQSKLNKQQVQQLLKALEEQEKKLQEKTMRKTPTPGQPDKDW